MKRKNSPPPAAQLLQYFKKIPRQIPEGIPEAYMGGRQSKLIFLGLKVPSVRAALGEPFDFFQSSPDQIFKSLHGVFLSSQVFEVMCVALNWVSKFQRQEARKGKSLLPFWKHLQKWVKRVDNWAHADELSKIFAHLLEDHPEQIYPVLHKWHQSKNPWERRVAVVSLLCYAGLRKKSLPFPQIIQLVENLMEDTHYYVQKGVGWTLRETGSFYPVETWAYLEKNAARIPPAAWQAATEKLPAVKKSKLKKLRASGRSGARSSGGR